MPTVATDLEDLKKDLHEARSDAGALEALAVYPVGEEGQARAEQKNTTEPLAQELVGGYKGFKPVYLQVIAMSVAGLKDYEIAEFFGRSPGWVWNVKNHPELQGYKQQLTLELAREAAFSAREIIQAHTSEAAMKIVSLMRNAKKEELQLRAAENILDRGGLPKAEVHTATNIKLDATEMAAIRVALDQMGSSVPALEEVHSTHDALSAARREIAEKGA